ncbi:hypothetical protein EIP91_008488 [Steccherinum ochraceum]|uniref:Dolichyl-phosphate-mannose--protein mannosyltransferase n=1 Tax=Steccherinum ochraceum TaxID=92696 RepID=A0A4R0RPU1_9APHY|nr:hypothetical protein EIP91_008488 [Steccherinum ochraceum]
MSANVRVRRPPSPPGVLPSQSHHAQRHPDPRLDHLDADARRAAVSKGYGPGRKHHASGGLNITPAEWKLLFGVVVMAAFVRLFRISNPASVVFDEVHFGKFASRYIKSTYFVDVHPPLAKLLITLAGVLFGYDGNFDFKDIAKPYEHVPYVAMRLLPALLGVATVPLSYLTLRALDCRATTALLASFFVTFENGLITQSRHILLDSPLIFFTALTTFLWVGFCNEDKADPFTESWWTWLLLTGLSLGAVVSCKWVGLFTIATVGFGTLRQLWLLLGDTRVSMKLFYRHFMARAVALIVVPVVFYMFMFWLHFVILSGSGDGDGFMSSEFQHTLRGRGMADTYAGTSDIMLLWVPRLQFATSIPREVTCTLILITTLLAAIQITLYPHRDSNNDWRIYNASESSTIQDDMNANPLVHVTSGMRIKLRHIATDKALHSHDFRPPVSDVDFQNEVSAYGAPGWTGDMNDDWIVEIKEGDKRDRESFKRLRTLRTHFRLKHPLTGCYLFSHKVKLPEWAYEQQEVTCNKNAVMANSLWFIETSSHPNQPTNAEKVNYRLPGFLSKFWELQQVMWATNAGLTDRHTYDSRPISWPRLRRGINFWVKDHRQIYLLGNPMIWYLSTAAVVFYVAVRGLLVLRAKRGFKDFENSKVVKYDALCGFLFVGWGLHYFPFYLMSRQLFLHHYFPALYFAILLSCGVFDLVTSALKPKIRLQIAAILVVIAVWNFVYLSPLAYGGKWTKKQCTNAKWLSTWDFSCNDFPETYDGYSSQATPAAAYTPAAVVVENPNFAAVHPAPPAAEEKKQPPAEDPKPDASETSASIPFGLPEPGHDVFGGKEPDKVENSHAAASEAAATETQPKVSAAVEGSESESASSSKSGSDSASSSTESVSAASLAEDAAGPVFSQLDEEALAAEKVRNELFPDE